MANPAVATAATYEPTTTALVKTHTRIPHAADDAYIATLIKVARAACENFLNRRLMPTTLDYYLDEFPYCSEIRLPGGRLLSITSLKYTDVDGVTTVVDSGDYFAVTTSEPGALRLAYGASWPSPVLEDKDGIVVRYVAGYSAVAGETAQQAAVPSDITHGLHAMIASLYADRGDQDNQSFAGQGGTGIPKLAERLWWPHRIETRF
jgi:uncharacterized phiE125 gp8 family phage protein